MERTILRVGLFLLLAVAGVSVSAQAPATQSPSSQAAPKPPDMVCFGYGPKWSVQFINGEARYLGINQPDQYFLGDFYYVPEDKSWAWHRADGLAPMNGGYALSATIQKTARAADPVRKANLPVLCASQSAPRRHGQRLLPQIEAWRSTGRQARTGSRCPGRRQMGLNPKQPNPQPRILTSPSRSRREKGLRFAEEGLFLPCD